MDILIAVVTFLFFASAAWADSELQISRAQDSYDTCKPVIAKSEALSFQEQIHYWAEYFESHEVDLALTGINPYFQVKDGLSNLSLKDFHYCDLDKNHLMRTLKNSPDDLTITRLNQFFKTNALNYEKLFSCLAMEESLGDPDTLYSQKIFREVVGSGVKPMGVKFYIDKEQPRESALNIGLFQFTPNVTGNINPCINSWNALFSERPSCQIRTNAEALKALASSGQNFNAYCGVHKIIETASIQLRSTNSSAHFKAGDSCVTLQMRAALAYNHFGPLQNSTGKNLESLSRCLLKEVGI